MAKFIMISLSRGSFKSAEYPKGTVTCQHGSAVVGKNLANSWMESERRETAAGVGYKEGLY